jgi:hypothetical protein
VAKRAPTEREALLKYNQAKAAAIRGEYEREVQAEKGLKELVKQEADKRRQFDQMVEANKVKKAKELEAENKKYVAKIAAESKQRELAARTSSQESTQYAARVAAEAKKRELEARKLKAERERTAARVAAESKRRELAARKRATSPATPRSSPAGKTTPTGETPAQAFERIFAPLYVPPAVAKDRPELLQKYQPPRDKTTSVQKTVTKARVTKSTSKAKVVPARFRATRTTASPRKPASTQVAKKKLTSPQGVVKPTRVTKRASPAAKGAVKPTRVTKRASAEADKESPSQLFERVAGAFWTPPNRQDLRDKLEKK